MARSISEKSLQEAGRDARKRLQRIEELSRIINGNIDDLARYKDRGTGNDDPFKKTYHGTAAKELEKRYESDDDEAVDVSQNKVTAGRTGEMYARAASDAVKEQYYGSDYATGRMVSARYTRLLGLGTTTRVMGRADLTDKFFRDGDEIYDTRCKYVSERTVDDLPNILYRSDGFNADTMKAIATNEKITNDHVRFGKDFTRHDAAVNKYLEGYGINGKKLSDKDIDKMLKEGRTKDGMKVTSDLRSVLVEKKRNNKFKKKAGNIRHQAGGIRRTARTWVEETVDGTDGGAGVQYSLTYARGAKIARIGAKSISAGGAMALGNAYAGAHRSILNTQLKIYTNKTAKAISLGDGEATGRLMSKTMDKADKLQKVEVRQDKMNSHLSAFVRTGARDKVKYAAEKTKKAVVEKTPAGQAAKKASDKAKEKFKKSAMGRFFMQSRAAMGQLSAGVGNLYNAFLQKTRILRSPFKLIGVLQDTKRRVIIACGATALIMLLSCISVSAVCNAMSTIPTIFEVRAEDKTPENPNPISCGQLALCAMQNSMASYMDSLEKDSGKTALISRYEGDGTISADGINSAPVITTSYTISGESEAHPYSVISLYKTVLALGITKYDNDVPKAKEDAFVKCCANTMTDIMEASAVTEDDSFISVTVSNAGLTNAMRIENDKCLLPIKPWSKKDYDYAEAIFALDDAVWEELGVDFKKNEALFNIASMDLTGLNIQPGTNGTLSAARVNGWGPILTADQVKAYVDVTEIDTESEESAETIRQVLTFAYSVVGCEYSRERRNGTTIFDCSYLALCAYRSAGIDIGVLGQCAALEEQYLEQEGCIIKVSSSADLKPGDLIFTADSTCSNGRHLGIHHVAIYAGNGMKLQASDGDHGVEYKPLYATYPPNYYVVARVVK